jgi:hypothetical protein
MTNYLSIFSMIHVVIDFRFLITVDLKKNISLVRRYNFVWIVCVKHF